MDSLTQIALGASIGIAIGGKKYGKKAALIGAIAGTIPDLDVLFAFNKDPIEAFTTHRGFSHSFLFSFLMPPVFAWLFSKIKFFKANFKEIQLHLIFFLGFATHILLDAMTIYGTQLFWPLPVSPVGIGSIFIIDLLYTLPLIIGVIWYLASKNLRAVHVGLVLSTLYLLWTFAAQQYFTTHAKKTYEGAYTQILVQPTPFNSFLWRVLVMKKNAYQVGYLSIFDKDKNIQYQSFENDLNLIDPIQDTAAVKRMQWFTKGFYSVKSADKNIVISDLRMGLEPDQYAFQFIVGQKEQGKITSVPVERFSSDRNLSRLSNIWARIWDDKINLYNKTIQKD